MTLFVPVPVIPYEIVKLLQRLLTLFSFDSQHGIKLAYHCEQNGKEIPACKKKNNYTVKFYLALLYPTPPTTNTEADIIFPAKLNYKGDLLLRQKMLFGRTQNYQNF